MSQFQHVAKVIEMTELLRRAEKLRRMAFYGLEADEISSFSRCLLTSARSESVLSLIPCIAEAFLQSPDPKNKENKRTLLELEELLSYPALEMSAKAISQVSDLLGEVYLLEKDLPSALLCFNKAVSMATVASGKVPDLASPYAHLAQTYYQMKSMKQAIRYASQAVVYCEEEEQKESSVGLRSRLELLYELLAECEDAVGKPERGKLWRHRLMKQQKVWSRKSSIDSTTEPIIRLLHTGSDYQVSTDISSSESVSIPPVTPSFRRSSLQTDIPKTEDPPTFRRASLQTDSNRKRRNSRAQPIILSENVLFQSYKQLNNTEEWSQIAVFAGENDAWKLQIRKNNAIIEKVLEKGHPWTTFSPQILVSMLNLDEENRIILDVSPDDSPASPQIEEKELFKETKFTENGEIELVYSSDSTLERIQISAKVGNLVIRRSILNDIQLESFSELEKYAKEVISPLIVVKNGKINLKKEDLSREIEEIAPVEITITPATEEKGPKVYTRIYAKKLSEMEAIIRIQTWIRVIQAKKELKLRKNRGNRVIYRSFALIQNRIQGVSLLQSQFGQLFGLSCDLLSFALKQVTVPRPVPEGSEKLAYLVQLLTPKQLLIARSQVIKGSQYQLSVYSQDGHVQIHAHKVHKTL